MLHRKIINFRPLIERSTEGFVGRRWLRDAVDEFLDPGGRRFFLLLGEPGSGKTSFMADLVRRRHYLHHFIGKGSLTGLAASIQWRNPIRFAESIGYQLIRDYGGWVMRWDDWGVQVSQQVKRLDGALIGAEVKQLDAMPRPGDRPLLTVEQEVEQFGEAAHVVGVYIEKFVMDVEEIVQQLLVTPLRSIAERWPGRPLVLVVDGLDEAEGYSNPERNILKLLPNGTLPQNVRFLFSSRPGEHLHSDFLDQCEVFRLSADQGESQNLETFEDARQYLLQMVEDDDIKEMLHRRQMAIQSFAEKVAQASQGNFLYLRQFAEGLRLGDESLLDADVLPEGLYGIYEDFLRKIKERRQDVSWDRAYKPVLGSLAVAREPLSRKVIGEIADVPPDTVGSILVQLKPFLEKAGPRRPPRYALYHQSFGEYLVSEDNEDYIDGQSAHRGIVDHFKKWSRDNLEKLASDDYARRNIADHMLGAGLDESLFKLINQVWMAARFGKDGHSYAGFLKDVDLAWQQAYEEAHQQIETGEAPDAIAENVRLALIYTSINSLSSNYVTALVAQALKTGLWEAERALNVGGRIPNPEKRARFYLAMVQTGQLEPKLREQALKKGLQAVTQVKTAESRVHALISLAPHLEGEQLERGLAHGLAAALEIENKLERVRALVTLVPHLEGERLERGLAHGMAAALEIEDKLERVRALAVLAPHLEGELREDALARGLADGLEIEDKRNQVRAIATLAPHLIGERWEEALATGLSAASQTDSDGHRAYALEDLAPHLEGKLLERGLEAALEIGEAGWRANALASFAPRLKGERLERCLAAVLEIEDTYDQARTLAALVPHLHGALLERGLSNGVAAALEVEDGRQVWVLADLAPYLEGEQQERVLAAALEIEVEGGQRGVLTALAPYVEGEQQERILATALENDNPVDQGMILAALVPHLRGELLERGLSAVLENKLVGQLSSVLGDLVADLNADQFERVFAAVLETRIELWRAEALTNLAPHLRGKQLERSLATALEIEDRGQAYKFKLWTQHLGREVLKLDNVIGQQTVPETPRPKLLDSMMPPHLKRKLNVPDLPDRLAAAFEIDDAYQLTAALANLVAMLDGKEPLEGQMLNPDSFREHALTELAPHLEGELLVHGLTAAIEIQREHNRARALAGLAPYLQGKLRERGLAAALELEDKYAQVIALAGLIPRLEGELLERGLTHALDAATKIEREHDKASALKSLARHLQGDWLERGLAVALEIQDEGHRVRALEALARNMEGELMKRGLAAAHEIQNEGYRVEALTAFQEKVSDHASPVPQILSSFINHLFHNLRGENRQAVLDFLGSDDLLTPSILDEQTLRAIENQIVEICEEWEWL